MAPAVVLAMAMAVALDMAMAMALVLDMAMAVALDMAMAMALALDMAMAMAVALAMALATALDMALALATALAMAIAIAMAMARANNHFNWGCASITRMESMDMATDESKTAGVVLDEQGNLSNSAAFCSAPAPTRKVRSDKGVPKPKKTPAISGYGCISEDQAREIVRALFESGDYAAAVIVLKAMQEGNK